MSITQINTHATDAFNRLITQYRDKKNISGILNVYASKIQEIENILFPMLSNRNLVNSEGIQLDNLGTILNLKRNGVEDSTYRIKLGSKISEHISEGTQEDVIQIFKILTGCDSVQYGEVYPAELQMIAINADPIGSVSEIRKAIKSAKPAGVAFPLLSITNSTPFVFESDPQSNGMGFGDYSDLEIGGNLADII